MIAILTSIKKILTASLLLTALTCCHPKAYYFEPSITYATPDRFLKSLNKSFNELSTKELSTSWGKEYYLGVQFAARGDYYRAITAFERSKWLRASNDRQMELDYYIMLSYYLGYKYYDAIHVFEEGLLPDAGPDFPPFDDLLVIIEECYRKTGQPIKEGRILKLIQSEDDHKANKIEVGRAIQEGDLMALSGFAACHKPVEELLGYYCLCKKNVRTAQTLNALLPGAGYAYVGLYKTAITSFFLNAVFIITSYQLFDRGYIAMGAFTTSLEMGWYFGGIDGGGLAARQYNERLYEGLAKDTMIRHGYFPVLMLQKGF